MNPSLPATAGKKPEANSPGSFCRSETQSPIDTVVGAVRSARSPSTAGTPRRLPPNSKETDSRWSPLDRVTPA